MEKTFDALKMIIKNLGLAEYNAAPPALNTAARAVERREKAPNCNT